MEFITLPAFYDTHIHLRDHPDAIEFAKLSARYCDVLLPMPNTTDPLDTPNKVLDYINKFERNITFIPTMYLTTQNFLPNSLEEASKKGIKAVKLYPEGVTTNSEYGIRDFGGIEMYRALDALERTYTTLCVHAELPDAPVLDRSKRFIDILSTWMQDFRDLKIVIEHLDCADLVQFVDENYPAYKIYGTITAHHMLLTLDDILGNKLSPLNFCKPVAKFEHDRAFIREAALDARPCFMFGSDSAPHSDVGKYFDGCAGCFTANNAYSLLADAFVDSNTDIVNFIRFTSENASNKWNIPQSGRVITLVKEEHDSSKLMIDGVNYPYFKSRSNWTLAKTGEEL
jgi:dihydroorotase